MLAQSTTGRCHITPRPMQAGYSNSTFFNLQFRVSCLLCSVESSLELRIPSRLCRIRLQDVGWAIARTWDEERLCLPRGPVEPEVSPKRMTDVRQPEMYTVASDAGQRD